MSYNASAEGSITLRKMTDKEKEELFNKLNDETESYDGHLFFPMGDEVENTTQSDGTLVIDICACDKYYDDGIFEWLDIIAPYTISGEINYTGEDGTLWRHRFENGAWYENAGRIEYDNDFSHPVAGRKQRT